MGVLVWINGPFGVGKTTTAEILCKESGALFFDPEELGFLLREIVPRESQTGNFQDIPLWRTGLVHLAQGLCSEYSPPVVMPMTVYNSVYVDEIMGGFTKREVNVFHAILTASRQIVANRIGRREIGEAAAKFSLNNLDPSLSAFKTIGRNLHIDTTDMSAEDCARKILRALPNT